MSSFYSEQEHRVDISKRFPNLSEKRSERSDYNTKTEIFTKAGGLLADVVSDGNQITYRFNPEEDERLNTLFPESGSYPPSVPHERRKDGMNSLYWKYFAKDLVNKDVEKANNGKAVPILPGRFFSTDMCKKIVYPFDFMKGKTLFSFQAALQFLQESDLMSLPQKVSDLLSRIELDVADDHRVLGATRLNFDFQTKLGYEMKTVHDEYILLFIEGRFIKVNTRPSSEKLFTPRREVKIFARRLSFKEKKDTEAQLISALNLYISQLFAMKHPYRG